MTLAINTSLPALNQLPPNFAIELSEISAIALTGEDKSSYLQGQVTCDVNHLASSGLVNGAHCDAKGKMYAIFRLFNRDNSHLMLQPKATIAPSLAALKKFGVFAKVTIEEVPDLAIVALVGEQALTALQQKFSQIPDSMSPVVQHDTSTLIYLAGNIDRYLLIDHKESAASVINSLDLPVYGQDIWNLLEITEGFPQLSVSAIGEYVPQMLNLQAIHGISFTKGCYLGQETVARMQYLGKNKRALFSLFGHTTSAVENDSIIEMQLGENWRRAANVLASYRADNGDTYLQAVLASDVEKDAVFRLKDNDHHAFALIELPYSLT